jgi:hypothetical protein
MGPLQTSSFPLEFFNKAFAILTKSVNTAKYFDSIINNLTAEYFFTQSFSLIG